MKKILCYFCLIMIFLSTFLLSIVNYEKVSAAEEYPYKAAISSATLIVHSTPDYNSSSYVTELAYGTVVDVIGESGSLVKIKYDGDKVGYVAKSLTNNLEQSVLTEDVEGVETYRDYCNTLVTGGFDESYCPYLYYLHVKHPNWTFKADVLKVKLEVASEEEQNKVVLDTENPNYWYKDKPIEGYYYYIKKDVIAALMDPRNSLFENRIFQFLDLRDSKELVNDASINKITGTNGNLKKYSDDFKNIAKEYGVNPLHLLARSKQEGANKATYAAVTGLYTTNSGRKSHQGYSLDGYYNFYNIGSHTDSQYDYTVQRGLAYAAGFLADEECIVLDENSVPHYDDTKCKPLLYQRPWNSPAKAITGGASFISIRYINKGQDTLYYQKFNVSSYTTSEMYTNQYMTNGAAAIEEGKTIYNAYNAGSLLNSKFTFVIPVFKDMPATTYQPVDKSSNNRLSSVVIDDKNFNEFDPDVIEYQYNLVTSSNTFKVSAKTEDEKAEVTGTGDYNFVDGKAQVKLIVTAEDESVNTYIIDVTKVMPEHEVMVNDIVDKMDVKVDSSTMYGIRPDTSITTLVNTVTKNKGSAKVTNSSGKVKASGEFVTGDKITIKGTSEEITYTIAVRGDINGDGIVDLKDFVLVQSHLLKKKELKGIKTYAGDVNYDGKIVLADFVLIQSHLLKKKLL